MLFFNFETILWIDRQEFTSVLNGYVDGYYEKNRGALYSCWLSGQYTGKSYSDNFTGILLTGALAYLSCTVELCRPQEPQELIPQTPENKTIQMLTQCLVLQPYLQLETTRCYDNPFTVLHTGRTHRTNTPARK